MEVEPLAKLVSVYGLGTILSLGIFTLLMYVIRQNEVREERTARQNEIREDRYAKLASESITLVDTRIKAHDDRTQIAIIALQQHIERTKEERQEQKRAYEEIREENERRRVAQEKIVEALNQINSSLHAMNIKLK